MGDKVRGEYGVTKNTPNAGQTESDFDLRETSVVLLKMCLNASLLHYTSKSRKTIVKRKIILRKGFFYAGSTNNASECRERGIVGPE